jgi:aspartate ammonia-lyase
MTNRDLTDLAGSHTRRSVEVMGISGRSLGSCPPLLRGLALVKIAAARANGDTDALEPMLAEALVEAARSIERDEVDPAEFPADLLAGGGSIAVHMNVNEVLAALAGDTLGRPRTGPDAVDPKGHAGMSQSTADVCHTAARLAVLDTVATLITTTDRLIATLHGIAERFESVTTLARTCLQDALPAPLSTVFGGAAAAISRRSTALAETLDPLHEVVLGTTVIGRGDHASDRYRSIVVDHLAGETGRPLRPHPTPASALQHGDDLVAVSAAVTQLAYPLLKLATDLRLLGSGPVGGFGEIVMPHVLDGSSFFGNKHNPVVAETVVQACLQVQGLDHTVQLAAGRAELYLQVLDGLVTVDVLDEISLLTEAIDRLDRFALHDLQADVERTAQLAAAVATR